MADGRILVVDDEPQFLLAVQRFLENSGFEVIPGTSCRAAEEIYNSAKPDAVVMDYSLGDGNAHEILPRLRASDPSIPIIIMTGHASIELAVQAVKLGAEHFLKGTGANKRSCRTGQAVMGLTRSSATAGRSENCRRGPLASLPPIAQFLSRARQERARAFSRTGSTNTAPARKNPLSTLTAAG